MGRALARFFANSRVIIIGILSLLPQGRIDAQIRSRTRDFPTWRQSSVAALLPVLDSSLTSDAGAIDSFTLDFDRVLSLSTWGGYLTLSGASFDANHRQAGYHAQFDGRARLREETNVLGTELRTLIGAEWPLLSSVSAFGILYGTSYSTSTSAKESVVGAVNNLVDGYALGGSRLRLASDNTRLSIGAGLARQAQSNAISNGLIVRSDLEKPVDEIIEGEFFDATGSLDERFFSQQKARYASDRVSLHLLSVFSEEGENSLTVSPSFLRRDLFFPIDSSDTPAKQSRSELVFQLSDALRYPLIPRWLTSLFRLEVESQSISRRTTASRPLFNSAVGSSSLFAPSSVGGLKLAGDVQFILGSPMDTASTLTVSEANGLTFGLHYEENNETVSLLAAELGTADPAIIRKLSDVLEQSSFVSKTTQATLTGLYSPFHRTQLSIEGTARIQRYDTPNASNHDDRDELLLSSRVGLAHYFNESLFGGLDLRGAKSHLVYLGSDRSSQNAVTQTLALGSEAGIVTNTLTERIRGEVAASYTVLDYFERVSLSGEAGSYLLRSLSLHDSLIIGFGELAKAVDWRIEGEGDLRVYERGAYDKTGFTERRSAVNSEWSGSMRLAVYDTRSTAPFSVTLGIRGFWLGREGLEAGKSEADWAILGKQSRVGPEATVILLRASGIGPELFANVWYAFMTSSGSLAGGRTEQVESHCSIRWKF